jgi:hypothetical protein
LCYFDHVAHIVRLACTYFSKDAKHTISPRWCRFQNFVAILLRLGDYFKGIFTYSIFKQFQVPTLHMIFIDLVRILWCKNIPFPWQGFRISSARMLVQNETRKASCVTMRLDYSPTSLIWHVWETRKRSYYQGVTYSIIWQIGPGCHNNEVLHKNTLDIFCHI